MLEQIVTQPTRGMNISGLCFLSHPDLSKGCRVIPGLSDRDAVIVSLVTKLYLQNKLPRKYSFTRKQIGILSDSPL